jgi:O-antigen/teichoic acid export membrane protein
VSNLIDPIRRNVIYSLAEYASQPVMMIVAAPILLRMLGAETYGLWMLANSITATVTGLGSGFGDAATKCVSANRGSGDEQAAARSLMAALTVNCALALLLAILMLTAAPYLIAHLFRVALTLRAEAGLAVRLSAVLLLLRFAGVVFVSAIRACQQYRTSVIVSVLARSFGIMAAVLLACLGRGLIPILVSAVVIEFVSLVGQAALACSILRIQPAWLRDFSHELRQILGFGAFTWLKSVLAVSFSHTDRLMVAAVLGTGPLSYYVLCIQLTQPIHSLVASGFNFLFPNLSARLAAGDTKGAQTTYNKAALASIAVVLAICLTLALCSRFVLTLWLGPEVAQQCRGLLILMTFAHGLLAISIVPHYGALALGKVRSLVGLNMAAGISSFAIGLPLMKHIGLTGGGIMRLVAGFVSLLAFGIVRNAFLKSSEQSRVLLTATTPPARLSGDICVSEE